MSVYIFHVLIMMGIYAILALSLNIIVGFAGLVSLGHAAFFGIGAYVSGLLMINGLGFPAAFFLSGIITSLLGLCLALPSLRVKDDYLAIVTLGFGIIIGLVFLNLEITGGADGLVGIPPVSLMGKPLYSKPGFFGLVAGVLVVMIVTMYTLKQSKIGRAWAPFVTMMSRLHSWASMSTATKQWHSSQAPSGPGWPEACTHIILPT